jgi:uncharacterized membrane protein
MGVLEASWSVEIEAPRDRCYAIAADVEGAPGWQGTLEEVEVITRDDQGRAELVHTVSDATVKKVSSELRFSYDPPGAIRWEQEKGEVKWLEGYWDFEELGDAQTRATYGLRGDPGRMLSLLLRGPVETRVKEFLTRSAAEGLKSEAESG